MKKTIACIVAGLVLVLSLGMTSAPASAAACSGGRCNTVKHYTPDTGYDNAILIRCTTGSQFYLTEGVSSTAFCRDVAAVYTRSNEELWCKRLVNVSGYGVWRWVKAFDAPGWHGLGPGWVDGAGCTVRRD